jgi:hypothetical protein
MRPTEGGAFLLPSEVWIPPHPLSDTHAHAKARQTTKFAARVIWRQTDHRLAVLRSVGVHFTRQASANLLHSLRSSKRCRPAIQLFWCRCRECARPAASMTVRCACRRSGSVVDPPSTRSWLRVNEIAPAAAQMEVAAKRRVHIGHSFWPESHAILRSRLALANPDRSASRHLTISTTTRVRRLVALVGRARKIQQHGP